MKVRVTLARTVEEYADIVIPGVESLDDAVRQVRAQLTDTAAARARLLGKATWVRSDVVSVPQIVESVTAD